MKRKITVICLVLMVAMTSIVPAFAGEGWPTGLINKGSSKCKHSYYTKVISNRNCGFPEVTEKRCNKCAYLYRYNSKPATGNHTYKWQINKATCGSNGTKAEVCTGCKRTRQVVTIPATGHSWSSTGTIKAASCTQDGETGYKCSRCGAKKTEKFYARNAHFFSKIVVTKAATCTSAGSKTSYCSRCGVKGTTSSIPALGHSWSGYKVTKNATCTSTGTKVNTCARCRTKQTQTIAKKSHSYTSWTKTGSKKKVGNKYQYQYKRRCTAGCNKTEYKWQ